MLCKKCGLEIADNAVFCIGCGTTVKNEDVVKKKTEAPVETDPKEEPPASEAESQEINELPTPDRNDIDDQTDASQDDRKESSLFQRCFSVFISVVIKLASFLYVTGGKIATRAFNGILSLLKGLFGRAKNSGKKQTAETQNATEEKPEQVKTRRSSSFSDSDPKSTGARRFLKSAFVILLIFAGLICSIYGFGKPAVFLIWIISIFVTTWIAGKKGEGFLGFFVGCLLGPIGILIALASSGRNQTARTRNRLKTESQPREKLRLASIFRPKPALAILLIFVALSSVVYVLINGHENRILEDLVRIDPVPHARELVRQEKYSDASNYLSYFMDYEYVNQDPEAVNLFDSIESKRGEYGYKAKKVWEGIVSGQSDESEGQVAVVVSDLFFIGDVRDITKESMNYLGGKEVDEVSAALSAIGLTATGAALFTGGATASAKPALSFLKYAKKLGKIPKWLGGYFVESLKVFKETKKLDRFMGLFEKINALCKASGPRATLELLGKSKDINDFKKLAKLGSKFGNKTATLLKITGDAGINAFNKMKGVPKAVFLEAATFGRDGVRALAKVGPNKFRNFFQAKTAKTGAKTVIKLGKVEGALPEKKIVELAEKIKGPNDIKEVRKIIGKMKLPEHVREDTFMRMAIHNKRLSQTEAEKMFSNLRETPGFSSTLSKINGVNPNQRKGHLNELRIANQASENSFKILAIGKKFNDGIKKGNTDIDVLFKKNNKTFAIEAKDVEKVDIIVIRKDMDSLVAYREKNSDVNLIFTFTKKPPSLKMEKRIEVEAQKKGIQVIYGDHVSQITQIEELYKR